MNLHDVDYHHFVGELNGNTITDRSGTKLTLEGDEVFDASGEIVGTFIDGRFFNRDGKLMAITLGDEK